MCDEKTVRQYFILFLEQFLYTKNHMIIQTLLAAGAVSLLSLLGVFFFGKNGHLVGTNRFIVPIAIGMFLGVVFFELIPETLDAAGEAGSIAIVFGFLSFYLLSYILRTYHHHHDNRHNDDGCEDAAGASLLLAGDTVHNFADGVVIASAFLINPAVGIATTIGIALHEIPQEIAEFGVLLRAGYTKQKATLYNFLSAISIIGGAVLTLLLAESFGGYIWILTGIAAGNLLYIVASDLIPSLHESTHGTRSFMQSFFATLVGLIAITFLLGWTHEDLTHTEDAEIEQTHSSPIEQAIEASRAETERMRAANEEHVGVLEAI